MRGAAAMFLVVMMVELMFMWIPEGNRVYCRRNKRRKTKQSEAAVALVKQEVRMRKEMERGQGG